MGEWCCIQADIMEGQIKILESQLQQAQAENKRLTQLLFKEIHFDKDDLNIKLGGEGAMMFMNYLVDLFKMNGGENFLTCGVEGDGHRYAITIQNCDGELTPAQKMEQFESENAALRADIALKTEALQKWKHMAHFMAPPVYFATGESLEKLCAECCHLTEKALAQNPGDSLLNELEHLRAENVDKPTIEQVAWVFEKIVKNGKLPGSVRYLIYDVMGFSGEAYEPLYRAGGMAITNAFVEIDVEIEKLRAQLAATEKALLLACSKLSNNGEINTPAFMAVSFVQQAKEAESNGK